MSSIKVDNLTKKFRDHQALSGVSFTVPADVRCVGFLGPNGSGKTTAIRIMTGLLRPTSGNVTVAGVDVLADPDAIRSKIGYVEQHPALIPWMTGMEFLEFTGRLFRLSSSDVRNRARELLERVGISDAANRKIGGYSGGMKKRLGIAQALMGRPEIVFLDEPVAEMDPIGRAEVLQLLEELKKDTTLFMSSHILEDIERTADRIIIMNQGAIREISTLHELKTKYQTSRLRLGVADRHLKLFEQIKGMDHLVDVLTMGKENLFITPTDKTAFTQRLQSLLHEERYVLTHFEWETPSLEEIFMKVVNAS